jgi:uncharacterized SAM-binding protein YcdF (DUF218 family)
VDLDVTTRALLKPLLFPPGLLLAMLLAAWVLHRRLSGRLLLLLATLLLYALSTPAGVGWLARQVETVPPAPVDRLAESPADAILVFMAGVDRDNPELGGADRLSALSLERLDHALRLHRRTGLPIIASGGSVDGDSTPTALLAARWLREQAGAEIAAVERDSRDTWENAQFSRARLTELGLSRPLLVTHAFHMPRALFAARGAGLDAVPAPFGYRHRALPPGAPINLADWLPQANALADSYLLLHELAGLSWYRATRP